MAASKQDLDDYSVYSHLSDEELLQVAVERSLTDKCSQPELPTTSSSSDHTATPTQTNPPPQSPYSLRRLQRGPSSHRPPPRPPDIQNCANPPTALSRFLYQILNRECSPIETIIVNGDAEALMDLVQRRSSSLKEPNDEGWIALHEAAFYGQVQCLRILVRADPDSVNVVTQKNQTALFIAAGRRNLSCVQFLLTHGANPNTANKNGETPLFAACECPNEAIVELLLRSGAQVNRSCNQGETPLHQACRHSKTKLCKILLDAGANLKARNIYSIQPVFTAAQHGHTEIIHLLAKRGADINTQAGDGATPLYEASKNGHVSTVEALLTLKADANRSTKSGLLPLHVAVQNNHARVVSLLVPVTSRIRIQHCGISPLHIAAEKNRDHIMEILIDFGFDVNSELSADWSRRFEDRRTTVLYFSVFNGNLDAAEMLLNAGANPNLDIFNPLLIAVRLGWIDMAVLLLKYGANVNVQLTTQPSSFPSAILLGMESLSMLKLVLDYGCDPRPCFHCPYGQKPHPAIAPSRRPGEEPQGSRELAHQHHIQFCEAISISSFSRLCGNIISLLLDYVGHVRLCSRLLDILESHSDWVPIKLKALPPHPLMQICRLEIRRLVGVHRLGLIHSLPLPVRLIRFLNYDLRCSLT
ncbi:ankyrin repeat and SOCS box protein 2-like isoform 1-T2 [Pholidichthys leucotaenia]